MSVAIVGTGLVSPWARTPEEHALFLRAGVAGPPRAPFVHALEQPLKVRAAPWLGTSMPLPDRLFELAKHALDDALRPLIQAFAPLPSSLWVCASLSRAPDALALVERAFSAHGPPPRAEHLGEDAGVFKGLERAERALRDDPRRLVAIVAVDSFVSLAALNAWAEHAPGPWTGNLQPLSEGAAAFVLTSPNRAREAQLRVLGAVTSSAVAADPANDRNDDAATGRALTALLQKAPSARPFRFAFGPALGGGLRGNEWHYATARNVARFEPATEMRGIESEVGRCGAAAGAMDLAYGLALQRCDAGTLPAEPRHPFVAWAISPDGTRGLAVAAAEPVTS